MVKSVSYTSFMNGIEENLKNDLNLHDKTK